MIKFNKRKLIKAIVLIQSLIFALVCMSSICFSTNYSVEDYYEDVELIAISNDKDDFPLEASFEYLSDTVHYSTDENNDFGTPLLLHDELQFCLIFSSKNNDNIEDLSIRDKSNIIYTEESTNSFSFTNEEINISERYEYQFTYNDYYYCGYFSLHPNGDYKIYLDMLYNYIEICNSTVQRNTTTMSESESNNSFATADTAYANRTIRGTLSSSTDVDYYKYSINVELSPGYLDVMLYCPPGTNYNFTVYGGSNHVILGNTSSGFLGDCQLLRINLSTQNTTYTNIWIKVSKGNTSSNYNKQYYLNASAVSTYPFYSQKASTIDNVVFWNSEFLDTLTFSNSNNPNMPFYTSDTSAEMNSDDWMRQGCYIASMAMKLRASNYTMNGHDYRTGFTGNLVADPFTVMLANININGYGMTARQANQIISADLSNNCYEPIYVIRSNINSRFGSNITYNDVSSFGTNQKKYALSSALSNSQGGIIICLSNGTATHYMVIKSIKSNATNPEDYFIVLDPATDDISGAEGVPFNKCATYSANPLGNSFTFNFGNIVSFYA